MKNLLQLFPQPGSELVLEGLYLQHRLEDQARPGKPLVYANYISSLDGRIALAQDDQLIVPVSLANPRDWRLFLELAAQAHVLITSGRYLRDFADGMAQDILIAPYTDSRHADLQIWRRDQGLPPYPALAILSESLDFPLPDILRAQQRCVLIFTGAAARADKVAYWRDQGIEVLLAGEGSGAHGRLVIEALAARGHRLIYAVTGPQVLHALLMGGVLNRLYLTIAHRLLGGERLATLVQGPQLPQPYDLRLETLYYDPHAPEGVGQLMACYSGIPSKLAEVAITGYAPTSPPSTVPDR